jgi:hypothetical protein
MYLTNDVNDQTVYPLRQIKDERIVNFVEMKETVAGFTLWNFSMME